jgi:hypothetical protein
MRVDDVAARYLAGPAVEGGEFAGHVEALRMFAYGTLAEYRGASGLPALDPLQELKLKKLTVATMAEDTKVHTYNRNRLPGPALPNNDFHCRQAVSMFSTFHHVCTVRCGVVCVLVCARYSGIDTR